MGWLRQRYRRLKGGRSHEVKEKVRLRSPITWDRFDQACYAINLDPDEVRKSGRQAWEDIETPSLDQMQQFIDLVVETPGKYDLRRDFDAASAKAFFAAIAGFFLLESQMNSSELGGLLTGSSKRPAFQFQMETAYE